MSKMKNKKIIILILIVIAAVLALTIGIFLNKNAISNILLGQNNIFKLNEENEMLTYYIYDNQELYDSDANTNNLKMLLKLYHPSGIEYIVKPDGTKINANGKNTLYIDYNSALDEEKNLIIKLLTGEEISKTTKITEEVINNQSTVTKIEGQNGNVENVEYTKKEPSDKTYYRINTEGGWEEYKDNISMTYPNTEDYIETEESWNVDAVLNLKKADINGNILYTSKNCTLSMKKVNFNIFRYIQVKGKSLANCGFSYYTPNNEYFGFSVYNLRVGHDTGRGNFSGNFTFDPSKIKISKINKIKVEFMQRSIYGYVQSSVEVYYKDGTKDTATVNSHTGDTWTSYIAQIVPNSQKEINYIKFNIWGRDEAGGNFEAYVKNIYVETDVIGEIEYN